MRSNQIRIVHPITVSVNRQVVTLPYQIVTQNQITVWQVVIVKTQISMICKTHPLLRRNFNYMFCENYLENIHLYRFQIMYGCLWHVFHAFSLYYAVDCWRALNPAHLTFCAQYSGYGELCECGESMLLKPNPPLVSHMHDLGPKFILSM